MFRWTADADISSVLGGGDFPTQADAEAWLTDAFPELVDAGASEVSLYEGDRLVYGPMSLQA